MEEYKDDDTSPTEMAVMVIQAWRAPSWLAALLYCSQLECMRGSGKAPLEDSPGWQLERVRESGAPEPLDELIEM